MSTEELSVRFMSRLSDQIEHQDTDTVVGALLNVTISVLMAREGSDEGDAIEDIGEVLKGIAQDNDPVWHHTLKALVTACQAGRIDASAARSAILLHFGKFPSLRAEQITASYIDDLLAEVRSGEVRVDLAIMGLQDSIIASYCP